MKPNGKSVVKVVVLTLCVIAALSISGQAQSARGMFKLPIETHWGKLVLAPGEYDFQVTDAVAGRMITVHSIASGWSGMILATDSSQTALSPTTKLLLTKSEGGTYVRSLYLGDYGIVLNYGMSRPEKIARVMRPRTVASASGAQ